MTRCFGPCFTSAGPNRADDRNNARARRGRDCGTCADMPRVDYSKVNEAIDKIAEDMVAKYVASELVAERGRSVSAMERYILETIAKHQLTMIATMAFPYILPALKDSLVCERQCS